jgi:uncharacterized membrane protein
MTGLAVTLVPFGGTWHDWGHGGPEWWFVFVVLFWILVVGGILLVFRGSRRWTTHSVPAQRESALEVLERRFAEGQLTAEDYQTRRRILSGNSDDD